MPVTVGHSLFRPGLHLAQAVTLPVIFRSDELSIAVFKVSTWQNTHLPQTRNTKLKESQLLIQSEF